MNIVLSARLSAAAGMVTPGNRLADIGTDHGYLPIWLVSEGFCPVAIAADLRPGPLDRAKAHVCEVGLDGRIELRLSDGLKEIKPGEADTVTVTGMGGPLICKILSESEETARSAKELILSPQSEIEEFRIYLLENDYNIVDEAMVYEDGKYYVIVKAVPFGTIVTADGEPESFSHSWSDNGTEERKTETSEEEEPERTDGRNAERTEERNARRTEERNARRTEERNARRTEERNAERTDGKKPEKIDFEEEDPRKANPHEADSHRANPHGAAPHKADLHEVNPQVYEPWSDIELKYGKYLIRRHPQVFLKYLKWRMDELGKIRISVAKQSSDKAARRVLELDEELSMIRGLLDNIFLQMKSEAPYATETYKHIDR